MNILFLIQGYGRKIWYINRNYTTEISRITTTTANPSVSTNSTMDLNDKPAMKDVSGNKLLNHSIFVIPVAVVIVSVVVIVALYVYLRRNPADTNFHGQNIDLIQRES